MSSSTLPRSSAPAHVSTRMEIWVQGDKYITNFFKSDQALLQDQQAGLVTVIRVRPGSLIDRAFLEKTVRHYLDEDDVFRLECLHAVLLQGANTDAQLQDDAEPLLKQWQTAFTRFITDEDGVPPGPYYLDSHGLHQLYKVHDDSNKAFVVSCMPSQPTSEAWQDGRVSGSSFSCLGVPTPSRLYFEATQDCPLSGVRIAVKDIYHMKGLRTSVCNRAYHDLYPEETETAVCLQHLVDKGAQLVGKTHLSSFAWKEEPTECVDFQAPFNPRGDGYQSPAGSSSGSGAAIASYDWLDFTLGTDTTGSGRRPGLWNGSFALRPSQGLLSIAGMVPTCPKFDVPSFFGRDIAKFTTLMQAWYEKALEPAGSDKNPWSVIYPTDYMPVENLRQLELVDEFAKDLCTFLGAELGRISISRRWKETAPVEEKSLDTYMDWVQEHGFFYDAYHCFGDFRAEYEAKHGRPPYVSPPTQWMWGIGALISEEQNDHAMHRFDVFRRWFLEHIMAVGKRNTLMILPIENLEPRYRDAAQETSPKFPKSLNVLYLSPTVGAPELVVPIGHVPYQSRITEQQEHLPVAVAVLAAPDMDIQLVDLVEALLIKTNRRTKVQTGRMMW